MSNIYRGKLDVQNLTVFNSANVSDLDSLINDLIKIRDAYAHRKDVKHEVSFEYDYYYDSPENIRLEIDTRWVESDEEYAVRIAKQEAAQKEANRIKREKAAAEKQKKIDAERAEYERLKKKYEK